MFAVEVEAFVGHWALQLCVADILVTPAARIGGRTVLVAKKEVVVIDSERECRILPEFNDTALRGLPFRRIGILNFRRVAFRLLLCVNIASDVCVGMVILKPLIFQASGAEDAELSEETFMLHDDLTGAAPTARPFSAPAS